MSLLSEGIMIRIVFAMVFLLITGCTGSSVLISGRVSEAVEPNDVELFYSRRPNCEFDEIAVIQIPGGYFNPANLVKALRARAANLGANAVHILFVQRVGASEYFGQARALRCNPPPDRVVSRDSA